MIDDEDIALNGDIHGEYYASSAGSFQMHTNFTVINEIYVKKAKKKNPIEFQINVTPHVFRHSKAMHLLESGVNLIYIRDFLGHESVTTTEIYAKANPETKRNAIEKNSEELSKSVHFSDNDKKDLLSWLKNSLKPN